MMVYNLAGMVVTFIADLDVAQDIYSGKGSQILDKIPLSAEVFNPLFSNVFFFMAGDEEWKKRRKAVAHMFFKKKVQTMTEVLKEYLNASCDKWQAEIKEKGSTRINIAVEFERIFAYTIAHICFGANFSQDKFKFMYYDVLGDTFSEKDVTMREAVDNIFKQIIANYLKNLTHPIGGIAKLLFDSIIEVSSFTKQLKENCTRIRNVVKKYV